MTSPGTALALRDVSYRYPGVRKPSLDGVSLEILRGEVVGVVGATGAGKSTLCLVAAGLAPRVLGGELHGQASSDGLAAIVFQDPLAQLTGASDTVLEEVAFGPVNLGLPVGETLARSREALAAVGVTTFAERHPARLSGGEGQLIAIASALAMRPGLLVLDEPTAELDAEAAARVADAIRSAAALGAAVLIAEQRSAMLARIADRVVGLSEGRVEADGPTRAVLDDEALLARLGVAAAPRHPRRIAAGPAA